jgi:hypothetical protein
MGELKVFPAPEREACPWCHPSYPCNNKNFTMWNCPRVQGYAFLDGEQIHSDDWIVAGVQFREDILLHADEEIE